jgi:hypothetical protein
VRLNLRFYVAAVWNKIRPWGPANEQTKKIGGSSSALKQKRERQKGESSGDTRKKERKRKTEEDRGMSFGAKNFCRRKEIDIHWKKTSSASEPRGDKTNDKMLARQNDTYCTNKSKMKEIKGLDKCNLTNIEHNNKIYKKKRFSP